MPSLARIERLKLFANFCNAMATAIVTVGVFTPMAVLIYGIGDRPHDSGFVTALPVVCICAAVALHLGGVWVLEALDDPNDQ